MKKLLFISGSLGLGHVGRDLEIAKMLRKSNPDVQISWLADSPEMPAPTIMIFVVIFIPLIVAMQRLSRRSFVFRCR